MSWNKTTVNLSRIDKLIEILKDKGIKYTIAILAKVEGQGKNDILANEEWRTYVLRRLQYENRIVLEQIIQNRDIELDDFIISQSFYLKDSPEEWEYVISK